MTRFLLAAAVSALAFVSAGTADDAKTKTGFVTQTGFVTREFTDPDGAKIPYVVFVPHGYDKAKSVPVILFLHGAGETKGRGQEPVNVGIGPAIKKQEKTFPFLTVIPQSQKGGWQAASAEGKRALAILDDVTKSYTKADPDRVSLTGLSMGGYGTWSIAAAEPKRWAAIAPICGGGNPKDAEKIKDIPTWVFHGDKDTAVKVERSREMVDAIKTAGGSPKYTEYPGVGHNSWDAAYGEKDFFPWLLGQKKK